MLHTPPSRSISIQFSLTKVFIIVIVNKTNITNNWPNGHIETLTLPTADFENSIRYVTINDERSAQALHKQEH